MRIPLFAVAVSTLTACASGPAPGSTPTPVPGVPVQTWTVEVQNPVARDIYLRNDDSVNHTVVDLQLFNCENLRQVCQVYTPNVIIPAGKTVKAMRLQPDRTTLPWKYQYTFHTRAMRPTTTTTVAVPAGSSHMMTSFSRTGPLPFVGLADAEQFHPRVAARQREGTCSRNGQAIGPAGGRTLAMFLQGSGTETQGMAFVDLDAAGKPVLFTETRGGFGGPTGQSGAESLAARTIISIWVGRNVAELVNEGRNAAPEYFTVTGPAVFNAASLGQPAEMMARVIRECGSK